MNPKRGDDEHRPRTPDATAQSQATDVTSYLISGPVTFGLIGYGLDRWWHTALCVPVGIAAGLALSLYVVWVRYGRG